MLNHATLGFYLMNTLVYVYMKSVIFKEIFFNDTQFFNDMLEKSNVHEKNVQKIVILNFNSKMFQKW